MDSASSLSSSLRSASQTASRLADLATSAIEDPVTAVSLPQRSWVGGLASLIVFFLKVIPGILYWLIAFTTLTLPSWLFAIFSTSLTFTLNATTL